jgi:hypothetical protein
VKKGFHQKYRQKARGGENQFITYVPVHTYIHRYV